MSEVRKKLYYTSPKSGRGEKYIPFVKISQIKKVFFIQNVFGDF
jgi:hypothetical protein